MKLLIAYNFKDEEAHVEAPNFYRQCGETIFPAAGVRTDFLPNLRKGRMFRALRALGVGDRAALMAGAAAWLMRNGKQYDMIVGWLSFGMIAAFLKQCLRWSATDTCLILYKVPELQGRGPTLMLKRSIMKRVSAGATMLLALDSVQAHELARALGRGPGRTGSLKYGVDASWYPAPVPPAPRRPGAFSIFVPGGAARDEATLSRAVEALQISVKRFQLSAHEETRSEQFMVGRATVHKVLNAPYDKYLADCAESDAVVICVESADKPVGLTSLLECMAMGRPIIMTRGASSRDYVKDGETALLFDPGDWAGLRRCIEFILQNPAAAARMGEAARQAALSELSALDRGRDFARMLQRARSAR